MQQLARRRWPHGPHAGGVGWAAAIGQLADDRRGRRRRGPGGLGGPARPGTVPARGPGPPGRHPGSSPAGRCRQPVRQTRPSPCTTVTRSPAGAGRGRVRPPAGGRARQRHVPRCRCRHPVLPGGYRVRSVADGEQAARVEAHRAAWRPATLPWPDGTPAGPLRSSRSVSCPGTAGKGLATALCLAACAQVAELGGDQVFINTGPGPTIPRPRRRTSPPGSRSSPWPGSPLPPPRWRLTRPGLAQLSPGSAPAWLSAAPLNSRRARQGRGRRPRSFARRR